MLLTIVLVLSYILFDVPVALVTTGDFYGYYGWKSVLLGVEGYVVRIDHLVNCYLIAYMLFVTVLYLFTCVFSVNSTSGYYDPCPVYASCMMRIGLIKDMFGTCLHGRHRFGSFSVCSGLGWT
uniref:Uncharacterized protein n=1 Tax=Physcomitrium patens TaxID=3218 RepID=A0A2K1IHJ4_PHYPA|nr:hypothetical protein PHYPA_029323 [Physcomitrium patens]